MPDELKRVRVKRIGGAPVADGHIVFMVDFSDGTFGTVEIPTNLGGVLIERIHRAFLEGKAVPELNVLRIDPYRDERDRAVLMVHTAEAHSIACILSQEQSDDLQEKLADFDDLPIAKAQGSN